MSAAWAMPSFVELRFPVEIGQLAPFHAKVAIATNFGENGDIPNSSAFLLPQRRLHLIVLPFAVVGAGQFVGFVPGEWGFAFGLASACGAGGVQYRWPFENLTGR